jgi:hypothetical protein
MGASRTVPATAVLGFRYPPRAAAAVSADVAVAGDAIARHPGSHGLPRSLQ